MKQACEAKPDHAEPVFLGYRWIQNCILEYREGKCTLVPLKGRNIIFPERHFAAALMHLYIGTFSIVEIASIVSATPSKLASLRTDIDFMMLVDIFKASFARHFRETLILNQYPLIDYISIAAEYAAFEELARNQIRVPLFNRMKQLANGISDKERYELSIDLYDLTSFKKLFSFFIFEEYFLQELEQPLLPQLKRIAREIVWSKLEEDYDELDSLLSTELMGLEVKDQLRVRFDSLEIH